MLFDRKTNSLVITHFQTCIKKYYMLLIYSNKIDLQLSTGDPLHLEFLTVKKPNVLFANVLNLIVCKIMEWVSINLLSTYFF